MRRRLVHYHYQMAPRVMPQHLSQESNHLGGRDPLVVQAEKQLAATGDCRQCCYAPALTRHALLGRPPARRPRFTEQGRQRDVGLILKVQNSPVFPDGAANLRQLTASPFLTFFLRQFEVLSFRLLISHTSLMQSTHHRLLGDRNAESRAHHLDQSRRCPKVGLKPTLRRGREYHRPQCLGIYRCHLPGTPRYRSAAKTIIAFVMKSHQPSMNRGPIRSIRTGNLRNAYAVIPDSPHCSKPNIIGRITCNQQRSFAHDAYLWQLRAFLSIPVLQNIWNGP